LRPTRVKRMYFFRTGGQVSLAIRLSFYLCLTAIVLVAYGDLNAFVTWNIARQILDWTYDEKTVKLVSENVSDSFVITLPPAGMTTGMAFPPPYCPDNTIDIRKWPIHCTTHPHSLNLYNWISILSNICYAILCAKLSF